MRHQARLQPWKTDELKAHLAELVDSLSQHGVCSVLDVMLELVEGELDTFLLVGRLGHLDPPRADGKIPWAILLHESDDKELNQKLRDAVRGWLEKN